MEVPLPDWDWCPWSVLKVAVEIEDWSSASQRIPTIIFSLPSPQHTRTHTKGSSHLSSWEPIWLEGIQRDWWFLWSFVRDYWRDGEGKRGRSLAVNTFIDSIHPHKMFESTTKAIYSLFTRYSSISNAHSQLQNTSPSYACCNLICHVKRAPNLP